MKHITIELVETNMREDLCDLGLGKDFLDKTSKAQSIKEKSINWTLSKLKTTL